MSDPTAAYAPGVAPTALADEVPRPAAMEVFAAGLAAIALAVLQLVLAYGLPVLQWKAYRQGTVLPGLPQFLIDLDTWAGGGRWVVVAGWAIALYGVRKRSIRTGFVIGSALFAIAVAALVVTLCVLASLTFLFPEPAIR